MSKSANIQIQPMLRLNMLFSFHHCSGINVIQIQPMLRLNVMPKNSRSILEDIQIQPMLRLNTPKYAN